MIEKLFNNHRPLMVAGAISLVGGIVMIVLAQIDATEILGINRWVKPMKFFFSIGIFLFTMALFLSQLRGHERFSRILSWMWIGVFVGEMIGVVGQAARRTTSHFNIGTLDGAIVFAVMGVLILISSALVVALTVVYFRDPPDLPTTILWGIRLGLIVFLAGSVQGGYMSTQMGHTIGAADGGPGLPLTNWSTVAGDLRVAHFLGLHAIQVIPLAALALERFRIGKRKMVTFAFAAAYFLFFALVLIQALLGRPLISIS